MQNGEASIRSGMMMNTYPQYFYFVCSVKSPLYCNSSIIRYYMSEEGYHQSDDRYYQLLTYIKNLFKRPNLCNNTYLFKQMHGTLTLPLYIIAEERQVAAISRNYTEIVDAIENSGLARVINGKEVKIIQHPTLKISVQSYEGLRALQEILEQKDKKFEISKRVDTEEYINFTLFSENSLWLERIIQNLDTEILFERTSLLADIRIGVDRIRRLKFDHAKTRTELGKIKYSFNNPPEVFVRKALESSDSEGETENQNGKASATNGRQKRYKFNGNRSRKPRLNNEDFPELK